MRLKETPVNKNVMTKISCSLENTRTTITREIHRFCRYNVLLSTKIMRQGLNQEIYPVYRDIKVNQVALIIKNI